MFGLYNITKGHARSSGIDAFCEKLFNRFKNCAIIDIKRMKKLVNEAVWQRFIIGTI